MEFIVLGYDGADSEAPLRRQKARPAHLESVAVLREQGRLRYAVAMLNEQGDMCGSVMIVDFASREELDTWLKDEPYVQQRVWERTEVMPGKVAPGF